MLLQPRDTIAKWKVNNCSVWGLNLGLSVTLRNAIYSDMCVHDHESDAERRI